MPGAEEQIPSVLSLPRSYFGQALVLSLGVLTTPCLFSQLPPSIPHPGKVLTVGFQPTLSTLCPGSCQCDLFAASTVYF